MKQWYVVAALTFSIGLVLHGEPVVNSFGGVLFPAGSADRHPSAAQYRGADSGGER